MKDTLQAKGLLLDMDGVLYVGNRIIEGANETLDRLRANGTPFRFITNTTTKTQPELLAKLGKLGIRARAEELFTAVDATERFLAARGRPSCHLLVRDSVKQCFSHFPSNHDLPNYVVIGDIGAKWDYDTLNRVFNMLMRGSKLICMHRNKYWLEEEGLRMDIGAFVAALEYVSDKEAIVIGKPSTAFFHAALSSLGLPPEEVAIVGDDLEADIGGGQASGLQGVLVKTGKYREERASRSSTTPDFTLASIAELPKLLGL